MNAPRGARAHGGLPQIPNPLDLIEAHVMAPPIRIQQRAPSSADLDDALGDGIELVALLGPAVNTESDGRLRVDREA